MDSRQVLVRCPEKLVELFDELCEIYGFTRAELMRTGAIKYCNELLEMAVLQEAIFDDELYSEFNEEECRTLFKAYEILLERNGVEAKKKKLKK